jgi:hypothetical protein
MMMKVLVKHLSLFSTLGCLFTATFSYAVDTTAFLQTTSWQCTIEAQLKLHIEETTGPGGMAQNPQRQFYQALGQTGIKAENPGGNTDSYRETLEQSVQGRIRLHHVYDGGPDGIQLAGWNNGEADVHINNYFEGTEQNQIIFRDKTTTYQGKAKFEGEEYEPSFQIWIYPEDSTYALEYRLSAVRGQQVEHCRMKEGMEADRKKLESATDKDMPLGSFYGGLTKFTCPTERKGEVDIEGGALSGFVENVPIPASGLTLAGEGESQFTDTRGVKMRWDCQPN